MALELEGGSSRAKRRRVDDEGVQQTLEVGPVVRISALPDDLRRRILTRLPLKDAIRSAALAQGWRALWKSRWAEPTSCLDINLLPDDHPREALRLLESGPRRRLDRFTLVVDNQKLRQPHLKRILAYAAECCVEDLHVDIRRSKVSFHYHLPLSSPLLAHLSLRDIRLWDIYCKGAPPLYALEVIHLHSVSICVGFHKVLARCPRLHTLDLRRCSSILDRFDARNRIPLNLRRITVAECSWEARLNLMALPRLCSFRYSGVDRSVDYPFFLPKDAALTDLYICLPKPISYYRMEGIPDDLTWNGALPDDLSGLSVLTVCSNGLKGWASEMNNLQSLRELQLLMLRMEMDDLADIYLFLKSCGCSNLERLFVQLPVTSDVPLDDLVEVARVELPDDYLVNLIMAKVMNFNWRPFEVQLVSLLLRKATSLHKLLLVSPNVAPLHVPGVQEADFFLLKDAFSNGLIIVSKLDDPETQPFHSEVFIKV